MDESRHLSVELYPWQCGVCIISVAQSGDVRKEKQRKKCTVGISKEAYEHDKWLMAYDEEVKVMMAGQVRT